MKEFLLLFRMSPMAEQPSPEQMQASMKLWQDWLGGIAAQDKLANAGNRLGFEGKVMKANNAIVDGPYAEIKEMIGGYSIVKAASLAEATSLAHNCPILQVGGNVEIRPIVAMDGNS